MKRIVRNYIVRDPKIVLDSISSQGGNYEALEFNPTVNGQVVFNDIFNLTITDVEKTELYVNGLRYNVNNDYTVTNNILNWTSDIVLETDDTLVFVAR